MNPVRNPTFNGSESGEPFAFRTPTVPEQHPAAPDPIPEFLIDQKQGSAYDLLLERLEKRLLVKVLSKNRGDRKKTAEYLGVEYSDLLKKLAKHRLSAGLDSR
jgi:DNA-binding NtrC family response regulator